MSEYLSKAEGERLLRQWFNDDNNKTPDTTVRSTATSHKQFPLIMAYSLETQKANIAVEEAFGEVLAMWGKFASVLKDARGSDCGLPGLSAQSAVSQTFGRLYNWLEAWGRDADRSGHDEDEEGFEQSRRMVRTAYAHFCSAHIALSHSNSENAQAYAQRAGEVLNDAKALCLVAKCSR